MKKLLLAGAAAVSLGISGPARGADMPLGYVAPVPIFNWTSCFLGAHIGGGWALFPEGICVATRISDFP